MASNITKQPEIRFDGFSDDWEQRKLGEVSQIMSGGTPSTSTPEFWNGGIDWYSPVEIGDQIFVNGSQKKITELGLQKSSAKILPVGTVLFTSRAGIGNTAILAKEGCTNQGFQSIVPGDELDSYFIFSRTNELKRYGETNGAGSTFTEISGKQMAKMPILIPKMDEQKKIGAFFKTLDHAVALQNCKLEEMQLYKKAMLQKMFPKNGEKVPEIRFDGFNNDWEQRKIGELYKTYSGATPLRSKKENFINPTTPWIKTTDLRNMAIIFNEENISDIAANKLKLLPKNTVLIAMYGGFNQIGRTGLLTYSATINQALTALEPIDDVNSYFLITELNYRVNEWKKLAASSRKDPNITKKDVENFILYYPDLEEQQKIGAFFKSLDDIIDLQNNKVKKLKEMKKALLQKMFV
ncbi:restriction endonuclease subunit S [Vagococcus zengguangii]|uniref:Restriction endonuclease subunit S n=1 Tax=Vagococcus zengguangii TaxID=2571750 RepID=A0A4D7CQ78_9ENTE|nr:restriction endonuclease subunit S [Vagococcus zengguangii]